MTDPFGELQAHNQISVEARDAEKVDRAIELIHQGQLSWAETMLNEVIADAPNEYVHTCEQDGSLHVKFWDNQEFIHYGAWQRQHGVNRSVVWLPSAYPRAFFFFDFIPVATESPDLATTYLDEGRKLEPTNPKYF